MSKEQGSERMRYVTQEQMDIIDLIRGEVEQLYMGDEWMKNGMPEKSGSWEYYDGKCRAYHYVMKYLDGFKVKEV